jgi:predicted ribosomally synthesized peptide with nif11-like leader
MNSVEQFFSEVSQDQTLQQQLQSISDGKARVNKVVELGKGKGYNFTPTEVKSWLQNKRQELSESELDAIAGGSDTDGMTVISDEDFAQLLAGNTFGPLGPAISTNSTSTRKRK